MAEGCVMPDFVIMPGVTQNLVSNSGWYVRGMTVNVNWQPEIIKKMANRQKIALYENRSFKIYCRIDKKVDTKPSVSSLLNDLILISVDGHRVNFRAPVLDPPPPGSSADTSRDESIPGYNWKYASYEKTYQLDKSLYQTTAVLVGSWSKFCYRGTQTYIYTN